jgi:hypothetical protein
MGLVNGINIPAAYPVSSNPNLVPVSPCIRKQEGTFAHVGNLSEKWPWDLSKGMQVYIVYDVGHHPESRLNISAT